MGKNERVPVSLEAVLNADLPKMIVAILERQRDLEDSIAALRRQVLPFIMAADADYRDARGVVPAAPGAELSEARIRRLRGE